MRYKPSSGAKWKKNRRWAVLGPDQATKIYIFVFFFFVCWTKAVYRRGLLKLLIGLRAQNWKIRNRCSRQPFCKSFFSDFQNEKKIWQIHKDQVCISYAKSTSEKDSVKQNPFSGFLFILFGNPNLDFKSKTPSVCKKEAYHHVCIGSLILPGHKGL